MAGSWTTDCFLVQISRLGGSGGAVAVAIATADGSAVAGEDYTAADKSFTVAVIGDTTVEADETCEVTLSEPINATLADAVGLGHIRNDERGDGGGDVVPSPVVRLFPIA